MARYRYTGPLSGITLNVGSADGRGNEGGARREVPQVPGTEVDLPAGHEAVQTLDARKLLVEIPAPPMPAPAAPATKKKDPE